MSAELEQRRRNVQALDLLTESFTAYHAGNRAKSDRLLSEAASINASLMSVLQGGMIISEIPNPERDFAAWLEYVEIQREGLAQAETTA